MHHLTFALTVLLVAISEISYAQKADGFGQFILGSQIAEVPQFEQQFECKGDYAYETRLVCSAKNPGQWGVANHSLSMLEVFVIKGAIAKIIVTFDLGLDRKDRLLAIADVKAAYESALGEPDTSEFDYRYMKYEWHFEESTIALTDMSIFFYATNYSELERNDGLYDW